MTLIYFLRHAESQANVAGILAGRSPGVALSQRGRKQALSVAKVLREFQFSAIYSSPLERCIETVSPLANEMGKRIRIAEEFVEMDYGKWTDQRLSNLRKEPLWKKIQGSPSAVKFPGGESFLGTQRRITRGIRRISANHPKGKVLVVSHGDPIKIALQVALDGELNDFQRLIVDPASLSIVQWPDRVIYGINQKIDSIPSTGAGSNRKVLGGGTDRA